MHLKFYIENKILLKASNLKMIKFLLHKKKIKIDKLNINSPGCVTRMKELTEGLPEWDPESELSNLACGCVLSNSSARSFSASSGNRLTAQTPLKMKGEVWHKNAFFKNKEMNEVPSLHGK